jgi:hypothetical protein
MMGKLFGIVSVEFTYENFLVSRGCGHEGDPAVEDSSVAGKLIYHLAAKAADHYPVILEQALVSFSEQHPFVIFNRVEQPKLQLKNVTLYQQASGDKKLGTDSRPVAKIDIRADNTRLPGIFEKGHPV